MSNNPTRLGRGLEALIPKTALATGKTIINISIDDIKPNPFQPRVHFDPEAIQSLADSIRQHGLAQPILVRKKENYYELVAGERRLRASQLANIATIPAIVKDLSDRESIQLALIENLEREDLNPIEEALSYKRLINEFQLSHQQLAEILSRNRSTITNTMRLLALPEPIKNAVMNGELSEGHARCFLSLESEELMLQVFERVITEKLNVREIENLVRQLKNKQNLTNKPVIKPELFTVYEKDLAARLASTVRISGSEKTGKIEIKYKSKDELDRITAILMQNS